MILHFGIDFDGPVMTPPTALRTGELYVGPRGLLHWLETQYGAQGYPDNTDYLRIELYRQALGQYIDEGSTAPFFAASFQADRFATAETLLAWRDELLLAGMEFNVEHIMPARLECFDVVEALFQLKIMDPGISHHAFGFADRFVYVLEQIKQRGISLDKLVLYEPEALQVPYIQRFIKLLRQKEVAVTDAAVEAIAATGTVLHALQKRLLNQPVEAPSDKNDQSVLILRARRDSDAAVYIAQLLRENPDLKPAFLAPNLSLALEQSLIQEAFPTMGMLSASLARPSLQVLKLAPAFLWEPVDVFKMMEFVTLPVKPLDQGLALEIARVLAQKPGMFSDNWFAAVYGYLEQAEVPEAAREQYTFWFDRRRYAMDATAPKRDAIAIYAHLQDWGREQFDSGTNKNASLLLLSEQARRIRELLEALPEQRIGFLELERIVRTIYEPSPMQLGPAELGRFEFVHNPGALATNRTDIIWWNCVHDGAVPQPEKWFKEEREFFDSQHITLYTSLQQSRLNLWRNQRPVFAATNRLILVVPDAVDGADCSPNLLLGDIEATFPNHKQFTYQLDQPEDRTRLSACLRVQTRAELHLRIAGRPQPQLRVRRPDYLAAGDYETPTNLERLFYYPHRWFFRQQLKLYPSSLLSVTGDTTLLGNLAHRLFEMLLKTDHLDTLDKKSVAKWIREKSVELFEREGATMLLYGREPERDTFLNKVSNAAWGLISLLRSNNWNVLHTELDLEGDFAGIPVRGVADLVLQRGDELAIVDLKWSGARRRKELIMNGEDLQLVLYARMLPPPENWPHTAYFILDEGKMIARNKNAFKEAEDAGKGADHQDACAAIFEKMERTFRWRIEQLEKGMLELRTERTAGELEAIYENQLFDLLEMKTEDARWDDYRTLLLY